MLRVLEEEADSMGISINALVNIILRRFSEFNRYLAKVDMIVINRETLTSLIESMNETQLSAVGKKLGSSIMPDTIIFWKKELSQGAVREYVEKAICRYGQLGTYDEMVSHNVRTVVIRHRLGKKGSVFLESYLKSGIQHLLGITPAFESTDSSIKYEMVAA
jgi:hypothetical protein